MRKVYAELPSVRVEPLLFAPEDISGERLLSMMKVDGDTRQFSPSFVLLHDPRKSLTRSLLYRDAAVYGVGHDHSTVDGGRLQLRSIPADAGRPEFESWSEIDAEFTSLPPGLVPQRRQYFQQSLGAL